MKYYEICFSPTGGTQKVANAVTKGLTQSASKVDLTDAKGNFDGISLTKEDVAVIAVPFIVGGYPKPPLHVLPVCKATGPAPFSFACMETVLTKIPWLSYRTSSIKSDLK